MYKILTFDGGALHGYFSIIVLKKLMQSHPDLIKQVDLIAGTSIGGIIALGLACGHDINEIEKNFIKGVPLVFNTNILRLIFFTLGLCPKYNNYKFKDFLNTLFDNKTLGHLNKKVLVPSFCLDNEDLKNRRWKAKIYHNFEGEDSDKYEKLIDVAMATSSIPVYFPSYGKHIDGAMSANNPSFFAIAQTQDKRTKINVKMDEISVLSIGSIRDTYVDKSNIQWGWLGWTKPILQMITERDTMVVNYQCKVFLNDRYHRIEPVINGPADDDRELLNIKNIAENYSLEETKEWLKQYWI